MLEDTICAISTTLGNGAISIVRVSGNNAIDIVNKIFKGKDFTKVESHTINYGYIIYENEIIDEVLVSVFKAPKTYTKEDIVEINCHGGVISTNEILNILLNNGCRLAEPGEFTKRAFLNGRISLTEAEAVNDLLVSKTNNAKKIAIAQLGGNLTTCIRNVRKKLVDLISNIEVNIDYPEYEDILEVTWENMLPTLYDVEKKLTNLEKSYIDSKVIKEGLNIAIIGRPNVGKSSILNYLLDEDKAIVTDIEGTTRDIVEGTMVLNGIKLNLIDTAGIRNTTDVVEKIGVEKSKNIINKSDLNILVLDNSSKITQDDIKLYDDIKNTNYIVFINKSDKEKNIDTAKIDNYVFGNTKEESGLDNLIDKIIEKCKITDFTYKDDIYLSNIRQFNLVKNAHNSISEAIKNAERKLAVDLIEIDIKNAWNYLGEVIGESYSDELLDSLFANFCLGK